MPQQFLSRTQLLIGTDKINSLKSKHDLIVGLGGVGAYAAEMIARAGVGRLTIIDADVVQPSNINRQLIALNSTVGMNKVDLVAQRLLDINPNIQLTIIKEFVCNEFADQLLETNFDYVVDAIDTLAPKAHLIKKSMEKGYRLVSAMGAGAKMDPTKIKIADISKTHTCNLAHAVRKRLNRMGIRKGFKVVFSDEKPIEEAIVLTDNERNKKSITGTISYMPSIFGCMMAYVVLNDFIQEGD